MPSVDQHPPVKKLTVRTVRTPWTDDELKHVMVQINYAKEVANKSDCSVDWLTYRKLRKVVTKLNKKKKKSYYQTKINYIKHNVKKLWSTLNDIMGRKPNSPPSFIEVDGSFITKPFDFVNLFNDYFTSKVEQLRSEMTTLNSEPSYLYLKYIKMRGNDCCFQLGKVSVGEKEKQLLSVNNDEPKTVKHPLLVLTADKSACCWLLANFWKNCV